MSRPSAARPEGARFITGTGGEELPAGLDPKLLVSSAPVPISNLDNVILAWEMNGRPLSLAHGGPLRMVVPGYSGVNNIKYVKAVALTEAETDAKIQKSSYRVHALGEKGSPDQRRSGSKPVKSWITTAQEAAKAARFRLPASPSAE